MMAGKGGVSAVFEQRLRDSAAGWLFLHDLFRAPNAGQWQWLGEDWVGQVWARLSELAQLPVFLPRTKKGKSNPPPEYVKGLASSTSRSTSTKKSSGEGHPRALPLPADFNTYEQEYLGAFEAGLPAPPCPLIETHWNRRDPTARIMHEHVLFYQAFGVKLRLGANETADHLRHQLEFLGYLCQLEIEARRGTGRPGMADEIARGRREFLERHPGAWIPAAAEAIAKRLPGSWPAAWMRLVAGWCRLQQEMESGKCGMRNAESRIQNKVVTQRTTKKPEGPQRKI